MIYWTQQSYSSIVSVPANSLFSEQNLYILLGNFSNYAQLTTVFDQYCIESAVVSMTPRSTTAGLQTFGLMTTALDYDNVSNLGLVTLVQQFATAMTTELVSGQTIQRALRPTVAPAIYNTAPGGFSAYGVARMWVDAANAGCPHYGYRSYYNNPSSVNSAFTLEIVVTAILGFRNKH
jgi:hypothetical protein